MFVAIILYFVLHLLHTPNTHSDQYLIDGLAHNNSAVIQEIYKKYSGKMYNWIKQHNGNHEQAEDIFQEAIIAIYRKTTQAPITLTCPFDAFLFVIVRNKWFSQLKSNERIRVTNTDDWTSTHIAAAEQDATNCMKYEKQHNLLTETLTQLQEGCQEVLKLSWSGLGMEEVAEKLKVTYGYVRKKKSLCMAKLMERIKNNELYTQLLFAE